jgi:hypothetical protein
MIDARVVVNAIYRSPAANVDRVVFATAVADGWNATTEMATLPSLDLSAATPGPTEAPHEHDHHDR